MDKILEVKNLKVSFRTQGGTVKAVRDISFDLERGKTLAIVGESGSGKSVTSERFCMMERIYYPSQRMRCTKSEVIRYR